MTENYITVAKVSDLENRSMKQLRAGELEVLLIRIEDKFYAVGAHCTHYGAPLEKGALCGHHVICPWHHAWFDVTNGDLLEPPALDALPHYDVRVNGEDVQVNIPADVSDRRLPRMVSCDPDADKRVFVILGGGAAGYAAAQTLREDGFRGRIRMITRETRPPYDRPNLSKDYLQGEAQPEWMPLRTDDFFSKYDIGLLKERTVQRLDTAKKEIAFNDGEAVSYDRLLIASGGEPRHLKVAGSELKNVFVLRSFDQADKIIEEAEEVTRVAVIGASFIGMETAASLKGRGLEVSVIAPDEVPFEKVLGPEVGEFFQKLHEKNGVKFHLGAGVKAFEGNGKVAFVILDNGEKIKADMVIVGIGVRPATDFLTDIEKETDGGIKVNEHLQVADDLYAAGDIAHVPDARTGEFHRIEHWRFALQQGRVAAHNMSGKETAFTAVPFFWTAHFGVSLRYLGHAKGWSEIIYDGDPAKPPFLAFYVQEDRIAAVAGIERDTEMAYLEQLMKDDGLPAASVLKEKGIKNAIPRLAEK